MSGGSGTRLWPLSRNSLPKQFCEIFEQSLITQTYSRLKPLGPPHILTVEGFKDLSIKALTPLGLKQSDLMLEPFGRNTAPAIAMLCARLLQKGLDHEVVGIFPADHFILQESQFRKCVQAAELLALKADVVTIGIEPTEPATGYGYIEINRKESFVADQSTAFKALGFREKPNRVQAQQFIAAKTFFWNAGMFIFQVKKMIALFEKHLPQIWAPMKNSKPENITEVYKQISPISIDYGIMEKLDSHICIPSSFQWSDVGSWDSIVDLLEKSSEVKSKLKKNLYETHGNSNTLISSTERTLGFVGVNNLIVIDTEDATLIASRGTTENVKELLDLMPNNRSRTQHTFEIRPWGKFEILRDTQDFKSKIITVDPGARLSYQSHTKREEHWTIINGSGEVILNDETIKVSRGKSVLIPMGSKHRIINTGAEPLVFLEVQLGSYFGEDDIIRYKDEYGRQ
jgi:mannose-1-phosphate guanylyltransferase/mannose-1-phosphate guanylyltransferase/mannose-6-phosphate isomerase